MVYEVYGASLQAGYEADRPDSGAHTKWSRVASFPTLEKAAAFAGLMLLGGTASGVYVYCEDDYEEEDAD